MGFWAIAFAGLLLVDWIISGGYITKASVTLGYFRKNNAHLNSAYWYSFWAAFLTWGLIALVIILIIAAISAGVALFGSGVGEVGVAGAGGAAELGAAGEEFSVLEREAMSEEKNVSNYFNKAKNSYNKHQKSGRGRRGKKGKKKKKNGKTSKVVTWVFLISSIILVSITGVLSAVTASEIKSSGFPIGNGTQLKSAYDSAIIAASLSLGAVGFLLIGAIVYAVYTNKKKNPKPNSQDVQEMYPMGG